MTEIPGGLAMVREMITAYEMAMQAEGLDVLFRTRVHNRVTFRTPDGLPVPPRGVTSEELKRGVIPDLTEQEAGSFVDAVRSAREEHFPGEDEPVFDDRGMEVETYPYVPSGMMYPLIAQCWCGKNVRQQAGEGWRHF